MLIRGPRKPERGTSLIEVLVTLLILAIALLGVAGLQAKMGTSEIESYQREQALLALADMIDRIGADSSQAAAYASYVTQNGPIGTGDSFGSACTGTPGPTLDMCEWSQLLKGASEQTNAGTATQTNVGGMTNARGCITQIQAPNPTLGVCTPGVYQVTVVWQGMTATAAPSLTCGQGSYGGNDAYRRAIASTVTVPLTSCF